MAKSNKIISSNPSSVMGALLEKEDYAPKTLSRGQIVEGKVVAKSKDQVFVDIGAKAEGVISARELESDEKLENIKIGDNLMAYVLVPESEGGQVILSIKKAGSERRWQEATKKMETYETVEVRPVESNKGGFLVDFGGIRGFIPSSHLTSNPSKDSTEPIQVKILEVDKKLNRLVFSEKEANPEAAKLPKFELPFSEGEEIEGKVSKILPFGILVGLPSSTEGEMGSVDGLVHISEISWERVEALDAIFKIGDKVKVKVVEIDPGSGKVNLSIKQLEEDPWKKAESKYPVGKEIKAEISRISSYGAFVQLEKGIEGLIHSSKIPYGKKLDRGDKVTVSIDLFSPEQRRVALRLETDEKDESVEKKKEKKPTDVPSDQEKRATAKTQAKDKTRKVKKATKKS
ncbi:MAG: S1 RNA-binding domain-containing protein [Candidatus Woykebacteria bacterium]